MTDHSNLFHDALIRVHDIAKNGTRNTQAWLDVLEIVDAALEEARRIDRETQATSAEGVRASTVEPPSGCEARTCGNCLDPQCQYRPCGWRKIEFPNFVIDPVTPQTTELARSFLTSAQSGDAS